MRDLPNLHEENILQEIKKFHIDFITIDSVIKIYEDNKLILELKNKKFTIDNKLNQMNVSSKELMSLLEVISNEKKLNKNNFKNLSQELINSIRELDKEKLSNFIDKLEELDNSASSQYIPAERNLISLFSKSLSSLLVADIPLPKFLLQFSSEFEKAGNELKEIEFLNVKYINGDGLDRHKVYFDDDNYLPLEFSSSGIQSVLPLYLTVKYFANKHGSIIIEEPEQNLFPKAQKETIQYIIEQVSDKNDLFLMTHSPYVLSTLNILLYAFKAGNLSKKAKEKTIEIIPKAQWIDPNYFSVYSLENGVARDIKGETGLISDNEIDDMSDEITEEFSELLNIYREHKNDK